ncbi:MAG: enoyl-CoA hydratase-related protein [Trebonia sp.]|uniref:enoyl-CoA hydratase-related protein n=1 Tax=Trebonia sp. TaxID=2767075 RepID=UPI002B6A5D01|nr:enoyl-CoA hydratase-related protein [Trebonia sp.]
MDDEQTRRYETVDVNRDGAAVKIALNRPDRMNAWSDGLSQDLLAVLREVAADETVRAVMLTGNGRAFCSGADLKDGADDAVAGKLDTYTTLTRWYHPIVTTIREMPKPVLTAVNGPAAGAGLSLALAGDLVVAAESAYFMLAFVGIGLVPDGGASLFVPSRVGFARAAEMAMLGERVSASKAVDWGLINSAWPDAEFAAKAGALLARLAAGPTRSYAGSKRELNHWMYDRMAAHLELEASIQGELAASADFVEGVSAFLQKRPPEFGGK